MDFALVLVGALLVALVSYDVVSTAMRASRRAGPITAPVAEVIWRLALRFRRILSVVGIVVVLTTLAIWLTGMWLGWTLIFSSSAGSVVDSSGIPADFAGKAYYAGYVIFTLGNGDYQPEGVWELVTVLANGSGLMIVTLSITYLVPLLSAVVKMRALAGRISLLGESPPDIAERLTSEGSGELLSEVADLPKDLFLLREQHLAYPILHYFRPDDPETCLSVPAARLYEAALLIEEGAVDADPSTREVANRVRRAIDRMLDVVGNWFVLDPPDVPPPSAPDLERRAEDRRRLHHFVVDTGWTWDRVKRSSS